MPSERDIFDPDHYVAVRRPLLEAETLPGWCYTSRAFYEREVDRIFSRCWTFVGREDEIPAPGDYLTFDGVAGPVAVIRGRDGTVRAFANACRHRGTRLLSGKGRCARIVCPYHAWAYDIDGQLSHAPGMAGVAGFRRERFGLVPVRLGIWAGFLFVNYDPEAPALEAHLGDMPARFAAHRFQDLVCVRRVEFRVASNWKLLLENALEAYHTGVVHRATLGRQTCVALETHGQWGGLLVEGETSVAMLPGEARTFPHVPGLGEEASKGTYFTVIYPSTQFAVAQDCMWWLAIHPDAPESCRLTLGSCFPRTTIERSDFEARVQRYYARWDTATPEDNAIAEWQQIGQRSTLRPPGRFSTQEFAVHALDNWVLDRLLGA